MLRLVTLAFAAGVVAVQNVPPTPAPVPQGGPSAPPASASPSPSPSASPPYRFVYLATPAPGVTPFPGPGAPEIREIDLSDQYLVTPGELRVRVLTNPEVIAVSARTLGRELTLPQQQPGQFGGSTYVPDVPDYLKNRLYDVEFVATVANGRTASVTLQLGLK